MLLDSLCHLKTTNAFLSQSHNFHTMKRIDIFCASQSSTAICMTMDDQPSSSSSGTAAAAQLGGRAIDRHNPIIRDLRRAPRVLPINPPCTSSHLPPITPLPYHKLDQTKTNNKKPKKSKETNPIPKTKKKKKQSTASTTDDQTLQKGKKIYSSPPPSSSAYDYYSASKSWSTNIGLNLVTPAGSSRYLLSDSILFDGFSDLDPVPQPDSDQPEKVATLDVIPAEDGSPVLISSPRAPSPPLEKPLNQIVELRVSLHCKGCEGKVRKHLSKMEGVKSFKIDFAAKKVTIEGELSPSEVLERLSKVKKNAQFWTSDQTTPINPAASPYGTNFDIRK